jgi:hypothetical protein
MKYLHAKPSDIADALGKGDYGKLAFPAKATLTNTWKPARKRGAGKFDLTGAEKGRTVAASEDLASKSEAKFNGGQDADGVRLFADSHGACPR